MSGSDGAFVWRFEDAELDESLRELRVGGVSVEIEPRPFDLLILLLRRANQVVTSEEIIASVWGGRVVNDAAVPNAIAKLRRVLKDDDRRIIVTVTKAGYRLTAKAEKISRKVPEPPGELKEGDLVPGRSNWKLSGRFGRSGFGDTWLAIHVKTGEHRVFKFCWDPNRLSSLKRETTLFRILRESLGEEAPVPALIDWQFEASPYYTEAQYWGRDLSTWSEDQGGLAAIPLATRLQILELAADAVGSVNDVGVLHKDLKPQNILVSDSGGRLAVRLCDFGTGHLLDIAAISESQVTRIGFTQTVASAGTPGYIAPELQTGGSPSVQSEVYALGVLLYQLAIGAWRPVVFGWEREIEDDLIREDVAATIDRDPHRRLLSAHMIAQRLRTLPERRRQREADRMNQLRTAELQRALERDQARRPWIFTAMGILTASLTVSSVLLFKERLATKRAKDNEAVARQVVDFLSREVVTQASPDFGGNVDITLKQAILGSATKISGDLKSDAPLSAAIYQSLAESLSTLSDPQDAASLAHQAAELYEHIYGPDDKRTMSAKVDELSYGLLTEKEDKLRDGFSPLYTKLQHDLPASDPIVLKAGLIEAHLAPMEGRDDDTLPLLAKLISLYPPNPTSNELRVLDQTRLLYVRGLALTGQYDEARKQATTLLPHFEQQYGAISRIALDLHRYLGRAYVAENSATHDFKNAEAQYRIALDGMTKLYGADSAEVNFASIDLADLYLESGRLAEAEEAQQSLVTAFEKRFGSNSIWTWRSRAQLLRSLCLRAHRDPAFVAPAVAMSHDLVALAKKTFDNDNYIYHRILLYAGVAYDLSGQSNDVAQLTNELQTSASHAAQGAEEGHFAQGAYEFLAALNAQRRGDAVSAIAGLNDTIRDLTPVEGPDGDQVTDARARLLVLQHLPPSRLTKR